MLNIVSFTFNAFEENTYLITNHLNQCWVIDPGMYDQREITAFNNYITQHNLQPQAIINTHAHIDHILGVQMLQQQYNIPFSIHELDLPVLRSAEVSAAIFGFRLAETPKPDSYIKEGVRLQLGDDQLQVFLTPGHSPGSISFYYPEGNWVVAGDVLFSGSIGRTDLPGGNHNILLQSIRTHLFTLPPATTVFSGHGPATRIDHEIAHNPFLK